MEKITSNSNNHIKNIKLLMSKGKARREQNSFIIEGPKMVLEAASLGLLSEVYVSEDYTGQVPSTPATFLLPAGLFKETSDTETPQGILAVCHMPEHDTLPNIMARPHLRLLILEDVRDPGNLGTMIRTSEAAGMDAIVMSKGTADMYSPKVVRSTMGSIFRVPCFYTDDLQGLLGQMKSENIVTYAAHLKGEKYFDEIEYGERCGVIIGNEANGISDDTSARAGELIKIPMAGKVESLNAAVAAALMMYQMK